MGWCYRCGVYLKSDEGRVGCANKNCNAPEFKERWAKEAIEASRKSTCSKSRRGVALILPHDYVVFTAWNGPPEPFQCAGSNACRAACGMVAVHAEERLLLRYRKFADGAHLVHAKTDREGNLQPSGGPSCWQCSRMVVECGVAWVWLYHEDSGWTAYAGRDFHHLTLEYNELPIRRSDEEVP